MRQPFVAGNWKMNGTRASIQVLLDGLKAGAESVGSAAIAVCVPFVYLAEVAQELQGTKISWGAQNVSHELKGAFTGEISISMLQDFGCTYVIVGHSERRALTANARRRRTGSAAAAGEGQVAKTARTPRASSPAVFTVRVSRWDMEPPAWATRPAPGRFTSRPTPCGGDPRSPRRRIRRRMIPPVTTMSLFVSDALGGRRPPSGKRNDVWMRLRLSTNNLRPRSAGRQGADAGLFVHE